MDRKMRVLWFSVNPACYTEKKNGYNGGGWISALEKIIQKNENIHLGVAFEYESSIFKDSIEGVDYYPICVQHNFRQKVKFKFFNNSSPQQLMPCLLKVIEDFKPDIIQCFGSEWCFGQVASLVRIPVVIHMQGSLPSYFNVLYPPRYSKWSKVLFDIKCLAFKQAIKTLLSERILREAAKIEKKSLSSVSYYMGRTDWHRGITHILSKGRKYYVCNEALRDTFYMNDKMWKPHKRKKYVIFTTGSGSLWKGLDVILKTAKILKENAGIEFVWNLAGDSSNYKYIEWMEKLKFSDCNINFCGILHENKLKDFLIQSDIYVHPAYIDNSPNALCEAMMLGLPCIASFVGGVPSILDGGNCGILVPANEPYFLADEIYRLLTDEKKQCLLSARARSVAVQRHSAQNIEKELLGAYTSILEDFKNNL